MNNSLAIFLIDHKGRQYTVDYSSILFIRKMNNDLNAVFTLDYGMILTRVSINTIVETLASFYE